jgi:glutamyl-tRNA synthetase
MAQNSLFFFNELKGYDEKAARKNLNAEAVQPLQLVADKLGALREWTAEAIHAAVNDAAAALGLGLGKVAQPIRVAVSGGSVSPPIDATLEVLGREVVLQRLSAAVQYARSQQ